MTTATWEPMYDSDEQIARVRRDYRLADDVDVEPDHHGHCVVGSDARGFMAYSGFPSYETSVGWYAKRSEAWSALRPHRPPPPPREQLAAAVDALVEHRHELADDQCLAIARAISQIVYKDAR